MEPQEPKENPRNRGQSWTWAPEDLDDAASLDMAAKVWELRKDGKTVYQISRELHTGVAKVRHLLDIAYEKFTAQAKENVEAVRNLTIERWERILQRFYPVMNQATVQVERMNARGETYTEDDWKIPVAAAHLVCKAIEGIARAKGLYDVPGESQQMLDERKIAFLKDIRPSIARIVESQPSEVQLLSFDTSNGSSSGASD